MVTLFLEVPVRRVLSDKIVSDMQVIMTDWDADTSDPGVVWADLTTDREIALISDWNSRAAGVFIETGYRQQIVP